MSEWLDRLIAVLAPPPEPTPPDLTWEEVGAEFGVEFPADFRALIETYGLMSIDNELMVYDPRWRGWMGWTGHLQAAMREDYEAQSEPPPLPGFPSPGRSLLVVGGNGNGDTLFLVVEDGVAAEDTVWLGNYRNLEWFELQGPVSRLLLEVLTSTGQADFIVAEFGAFAWGLIPRVAAANPYVPGD